MKKKIHIGSVDPLSLLGSNDENIKILEDHYKVSIVIRDGELIIDGKSKDVKSVSDVIQDMIITVNQKGYVTSADVNTLLTLDPASIEAKRILNNDKPVILFTHKGAVHARTPGQIRYFDAVLENDIVFVTVITSTWYQVLVLVPG